MYESKVKKNPQGLKDQAAATVQRKSVKLHDNRSQFVVQKKQLDALAGKPEILQKKKTEVVARPVIQRAIVSSVVPDMALPAEDTAKLNAVEAYMNVSLAHIKSKIKTVFINIAEMPGANPADTKLNTPGTGIVVRLASWFVRISSVGDICGMLAHEIGVHTLADDQMSKKDKEEELEYQKQPFSVTVGLHTHNMEPWQDRRGGRQQDHVNVGRDKGNNIQPLRHSKAKRKKGIRGKKEKRPVSDVNSINTRAIQYAQTMLRLGDAIEADTTITQDEKDQRLHDLLSSFLFDYARIIATDDRGIRSFDKAPLVAQVFNWYKNVIIARYGDKHTWLKRKSMQPTASGWGLRVYLLAKVFHGVGTQIKPGGKTGQVIDGISTVAGWGGSLLGGIGSGLSYVTPDIVKTGVSSTLRGIDHVAGEVENLVVPKVVSGGGWLLGKLGFGRG